MDKIQKLLTIKEKIENFMKQGKAFFFCNHSDLCWNNFGEYGLLQAYKELGDGDMKILTANSKWKQDYHKFYKKPTHSNHAICLFRIKLIDRAIKILQQG